MPLQNLHSLSGLLTLRPVQASDSPVLFAIYASTRTEELAQVGWSAAQLESFLRMQFNAQSSYYQSEYPRATFQMIVVSGQPAGRLYLHRRETEIRIMDIALLPEFRGRGLGTVLLQEVLAEAKRTAKRVSIHVESFNPAQRLYARLGFKQTATNGVYHLMEWSGISSTPEQPERSALGPAPIPQAVSQPCFS